VVVSISGLVPALEIGNLDVAMDEDAEGGVTEIIEVGIELLTCPVENPSNADTGAPAMRGEVDEDERFCGAEVVNVLARGAMISSSGLGKISDDENWCPWGDVIVEFVDADAVSVNVLAGGGDDGNSCPVSDGNTDFVDADNVAVDVLAGGTEVSKDEPVECTGFRRLAKDTEEVDSFHWAVVGGTPSTKSMFVFAGVVLDSAEVWDEDWTIRVVIVVKVSAWDCSLVSFKLESRFRERDVELVAGFVALELAPVEWDIGTAWVRGGAIGVEFGGAKLLFPSAWSEASIPPLVFTLDCALVFVEFLVPDEAIVETGISAAVVGEE
jgi:hypothetical protein